VLSRALPIALVLLLEACRGEAGTKSAPTASSPNAPSTIASALPPPPSASASSGIAPPVAEARSHDRRLTVVERDGVILLLEAGVAVPRPLADLKHLRVEPGAAVPQTLVPGYDPMVAFEPAIAQRADGFYGPAFSTDDRTLFFMTDAWGDSRALYAIDLASTKTRFVAGMNAYQVIESCADPKLVGMLVGYPHFARLRGVRFIDAPVLMEPSGRALGLVGNEARFLARRCGLGVAPPEPRPATIPRRPPPDRPFRCGDETLEYTVLDFLDGTRGAYFEGPGSGNTWDDLVESFRTACPEVLK
jgi:hypothetical protein